MNVLNFINTYIVKYLYIVVIIAIVVAIIMAFIKGVLPILKTLNEILKSLDDVSTNAKKIEEDINAISYTINNSIPFFVDIAFYLIVIKSVLHDYFKTKRSKRSLAKSAIHEYQNVSRKYNRQLSPDTIQSILWLVKQFA